MRESHEERARSEDRRRVGQEPGSVRRGLALLSEGASRLLAAEQPAGVIEDLGRSLMEHFGCEVFIAYVLEPVEGRLHLAACAGVDRPQAEALGSLSLGENVCGRVAATRTSLVVAGEQRATTEPLRQLGLSSFASFPLEVGDRVLGTLAFGSRERESFDREALEVIGAFAGQAAAALERRRLLKELEQVEDVGERKRAEAALAESEERFRTAVDAMVDGLGILTAVRGAGGEIADFEFRYVNAAACRMNRMSADAIIGARVLSLYPAVRRSAVFGDLRAVVKDGVPRVREVFARTVNGRRGWFELHMGRLGDGVVVGVHETTERKRAEEAVREREREYRTLAEHSPEVIARFDREMRHTYVNAFGVLAYGVPLQQILGKTKAELGLRAEWSALWNRQFGETLATGEQRTVDFELDSPNLGHRYFSSLLVPEHDDKGRVASVLAITRDVTARRAAEQALRASEERFRRVVEHIHDAIMADDADGRVVFANDRFLELFGIPREEVGRIAIEDYVAPEYRSELRARHDRRIRGEAAATHFEYEGVRRDGSRLWLEVDVVPIRDGEGRVIGTQSAIRDISERKRAEQALRQSEEQFRQIAESLPQIVWTARPDGSVDYYNRRWAEFSGIPVEAAHHWAWSPVVHEDDAEATLAAWQQAVATGETYEISHRLRSHDGSFRWVLSRAVPLRDAAGRIARWFGTATDIDDVKRLQDELAEARSELETRVQERTAELEQAHQRLRRLSRRLVEVQEDERRAIARELHDEAGQGLTAIMLGLGALEKTTCAACVGANAIGEIKLLTGRVMEELHGLSVRLRPPVLDRLDLAAALRQMVDAAGRGVAVDLEVKGLEDATFPVEIETTVFRVVQEALTNVVRHAAARRASVLIARAEGRLIAVVEDDGRGFDVEAATTGGRLGIVGMRERVELVGGRLDIESEPGAGTTVQLELPLATPAL